MQLAHNSSGYQPFFLHCKIIWNFNCTRRLKAILLIRSLIQYNNAFTVCPTAQWSENATTFAQYGPIVEGPDYFTYRFRPQDILITNNDYIYVLLNGNLTVQLWLPNATSDITILNSSFGYGLDQFQKSMYYRSHKNLSWAFIYSSSGSNAYGHQWKYLHSWSRTSSCY